MATTVSSTAEAMPAVASVVATATVADSLLTIDRDLTERARQRSRRKRQDIGRILLLAKLPVQARQLGIAGNEARESPFARNALTQRPGKFDERPLRDPARQGGA